MARAASFYSLWQEEGVREVLFELLAKEDVCAVRLASSACRDLVTARLFLRTHISFTANTFTKASRVQALARIGQHVEHLTFSVAHSAATFLPPLIHPQTGQEISFLYKPHTCMMSALVRPKYANGELGDILTQQYPPLFHAATNVPSFLNAVRHMPNVRHLTVRCAGQDAGERYRRSIVDYALISLRIAIERAPLDKLHKLSLSGVHPGAFLYLKHVGGFGCSPGAARRWRQIRKLYMSVDAWDVASSAGRDQLQVLDDFVRALAPQLEKVSFTWLDRDGRRGPCPFVLAEPVPDTKFGKYDGRLFNEVTGPMSPLPPPPVREPLHMPRLQCLTLRNATLATPQLRALVARHKRTVRQFDFENVALADGGSYEAAFAELLAETSEHGHSLWSRTRGRQPARDEVPTGQTYGLASAFDAFDPYAGSQLSSVASVTGASVVASPDDVQLPSPSAAVAAVSRELLDVESDLGSFLGLQAELPLYAASDASFDELQHHRSPPPPIEEVDEDEAEADFDGQDEARQYHQCVQDAAAALAHMDDDAASFSTCIKRRVRRHRRHRSEGDAHKSKSRSQGGKEKETEKDERRSGRRRHRRHHSDRTDDATRSRDKDKDKDRERHRRRRETSRSRSRSRSRTARRSDKHAPQTPPTGPRLVPAVRHHPFAHRTPPPPPPPPPLPLPSVVGQHTVPEVVDDVFRPSTSGSSSPHASRRSVLPVQPLSISAPILAADPSPLVLQPTVYDPSATAAALDIASVPALSRSNSHASDLSQTSVQTQSERRREMAEDPDARASALQKAKAAVLTKLSREYNRRLGREASPSSPTSPAASAASMAAAAAAASMDGFLPSMVEGYAYEPDAYSADRAGASSATSATLSLLAGLRLKDRFFGESFVAPGSPLPPLTPGYAPAVLDNYAHNMERGSAMVPLIFSPA